MLSLNQCLRNPANPWPLSPICHRDMDRYNSAAYGDDEKDALKGKYARNKDKGESSYDEVDHTLKLEDKKKKDNLVEGLKAFQAKTGINEEKYIDEVENAKSGYELAKMETKFNRAAEHFYEKQLRESGVFLPIHAKEAKFLGAEKRYLKEKFADCPLYEKGELNKVDVLAKLKDFFRPRLEFRSKLRQVCNNPMIRDEYFSYFDDQLMKGEDGFMEAKGDRLKSIMEEIKEVEKSPSAVQNEFRRRQRVPRAGKDTATLKKEVLDAYDAKVKAYTSRILAEKELFGGDEIVTPHGKIREAAWEFIQYNEDLVDFNKMDSIAGALDKVLAERRKAYAKRDKLLENHPPEEAKKLKMRTDKMRFHNLQAYLPELESKMGKTSVQALEYSALLEDAEAGHIPLFTDEEKIKMKTQMQVADLSLQDAKLTVLEKETIPERARIVNEYFQLPEYLRDDKSFIDASHANREKMLRDAAEQKNRESTNPLDLSHVDHFDGEAEETFLKRMRTERGKGSLLKDTERLEQQGDLEVGEVQGELYRKVFGVNKKMEERGSSQKDEFLYDKAKWMRRSETLADKTVDEVSNPRDKWQVEVLEADRIMYDMGDVSTTGGERLKLGIIEDEELMQGKASTKEIIREARYPQHLMLKNREGKDQLHLGDTIEDKFVLYAKHMLREFMADDADRMHLSGGNKGNFINSPNIRREMGKMVIEAKFAQYFNVHGENNTDRLINDIVN